MAHHLRILISTALALAAASCEAGVYEPLHNDEGTGATLGDAPVGGAGQDAGEPGSDGGAADAATLACRDPVATNASGKHNPGTACAGCHTGMGAPKFTVSGTLYSDAAGTAPVVGATIHVTDATGAQLELTTAQNGNFWTSQTVAYPVRVYASRCPDAVPMVATVASPGDCNAGGCHGAGNRIHLP